MVLEHLLTCSTKGRFIRFLSLDRTYNFRASDLLGGSSEATHFGRSHELALEGSFPFLGRSSQRPLLSREYRWVTRLLLGKFFEARDLLTSTLFGSPLGFVGALLLGPLDLIEYPIGDVEPFGFSHPHDAV